MTIINPFKGLRYNQEKVPNLASVVTPPYDIIDETAQARYYAEHPANIIRLELGLIFPQDTEENSRYTRAKQYLDRWMEDEMLLAESAPSLYLYQQTFEHRGRLLVRNGLVCGLQVEDYSTGSVLPHEETLSKPKADRFKLMQHTRCNFSSIFGLYIDEEKLVDQIILSYTQNRPADVDIIDEAGEGHRIWVISDPQILAPIVQFFKDKKVYIADGHHRYETALDYARSVKAAGYDYVLTTLVNIYDQGLVVFPTHRLVGNLPGFNRDQFMAKLAELFDIEVFKDKNLADYMNDIESSGQTTHTYGLYLKNNCYVLRLKDPQLAYARLPEERSAAWKNLDVAILDYLVLDQMLSVGEEARRSQNNLAYTRSESYLVEQVESGQYQMGFILNATRVQDIVAVANARDKMPQKSTYFYPKLITGLIINNLEVK